MLKIIFMGTPDFSIPSLEATYNSGNELVAVMTQPDRPRGRGKHLVASPVKKWVLGRSIPVLQPQKVRGNKDILNQIYNLSPDLIVTAAYGQILPKDLLNIPRLGCINVHASLLPKYRGASPIQQVLIDGEEKTGVSIMYMDEGMDTGDVILSEQVDIAKNENAGELHDRLSFVGAHALTQVIKLFEVGKPKGQPQDHCKATYCSKIEKSMGEIDWYQPASQIKNLIRGLTPWPGCYTFIDNKRLKVWKAVEWEDFIKADLSYDTLTPGTVIKANSDVGLVVACKGSALQILSLQGQGAKAMDADVYLHGNHIEEGKILGK